MCIKLEFYVKVSGSGISKEIRMKFTGYTSVEMNKG